MGDCVIPETTPLDDAPLGTLTRLLAQQERALGAASLHAQSIQAQISALALCSSYASDAASATPGVEEITDPERERELLDSVAALAQQQIRVIHPSVITRRLMGEWLEREKYGREQGVTVRTIHQPSALQSARAAAYLEKLAGRGVQVRIAPLLPFRMILVDDRMALVCPPEKLLLVRQPTLVQLMVRIFEFCWDGAAGIMPCTQLPEPDDGETEDVGPVERPFRLTDQQLVVLRLWAKGRQDESIARELQVSPRTLRRIVSSLLRRLGASSRFEAGVIAGRTSQILDAPDPLAVSEVPDAPETLAGPDPLGAPEALERRAS